MRSAGTSDASASGRETLLIYRHSIVIRLAHWVGVACVAVLLMSGLQIFNAHPALYLGQASSFEHPVVSIGTAEKNGQQIGLTNVLGQRFNTTGFLGLSGKDNRDRHAFPSWATLPSYQDLAGGRRWHFFFAWLLVFDGLIYLIYSLASGHIARDLIPSVETMLADNGYFSEANVKACGAAGVEPLIALGQDAHHPSLADRFADAPPATENPTPVETMAYRLQTPEGKSLYAKRKYTPEAVFGIFKSSARSCCAEWRKSKQSGRL